MKGIFREEYPPLQGCGGAFNIIKSTLCDDGGKMGDKWTKLVTPSTPLHSQVTQTI